MSAVRGLPRTHNAHEGVAMLVRSVPVRLIEVSRSGCRLECSSRIESGTSGQLAVELGGLMRVDDIRVVRCQQRMGAGAVYQLGTELLRTKRLGRRTVRMAIRRIIANDLADGDSVGDQNQRALMGVRTTDMSSRSGSRAPPAHDGRGP